AALQIAPVGDAHHDRAREGVAGAPAQGGELVAQLMIGGPDVVEELNLDDGLQAAGRVDDRAAHGVRLGVRGVVELLESRPVHVVKVMLIYRLAWTPHPVSLSLRSRLWGLRRPR